jgi:hypothetical protein
VLPGSLERIRRHLSGSDEGESRKGVETPMVVFALANMAAILTPSIWSTGLKQKRHIAGTA